MRERKRERERREREGERDREGEREIERKRERGRERGRERERQLHFLKNADVLLDCSSGVVVKIFERNQFLSKLIFFRPPSSPRTKQEEQKRDFRAKAKVFSTFKVV